MSIEMVEADGVMCVRVPEGTHAYAQRSIVKHKDYFSEVLLTFHNQGLEALNEVASRHGKTFPQTETALVRLLRTMEVHPGGIIGVLSALDIGITPGVHPEDILKFPA